MRNFLGNPPAGPITGADSFPGIQGGTDVLFSMAALLVAAWDRNNHSGTQPQSSITGLVAALAGKADDAAVVKLTGNQTVAGVKTFSSPPVVPNNSWSIAQTAGLQAALDAVPVDGSLVHDTGDENIAGIKTFLSSPIVPTPTTAFQAAPKGYVESLISASAGLRIEDEGSTVVAAATGINFVGASVSVADAGSNEATVTIASTAALGVFYVGDATGVSITDIANTEAAVADATAAPRGGIVQFGPGLYNLSGIDPILLPENGATGKQVTLQGAGGGNATILYLPTDGAVGEYFIAGSGLSSASNGSYKTVLRDLTVFGPDTFDAYSTSRTPCNLSGVMLDTHVSIYNCTFLGFRYGFNSAGNHNVIRDSKFSNCYAGARFTAVAGLGGDVLLDNVDLAGNTMASVAIANNAVATWHAVKGHYGFGPYAIYIESGAAAGTLNMYYCSFNGTSFEFLGNGLIFAEGQTSRAEEIRWHDCANFSTNNASYGLPSTTFAKFVQLHGFTKFSFEGGSPSATVTDSFFDVSTSLNGSIHPCLTGIAAAAGAAVPYIKGPAGANQARVDLRDTNFRGVAVPCDSSNAVTAKTLVEWTQFGNVRPHAQWGTGVRTQLAGVAMNGMAASSRTYVLVAQESPDQEILMTGGVDPTSTQVLVPSSDATNRSYVMPFSWDGTNATRQIVGQLYLAVAGSASVRARVRVL